MAFLDDEPSRTVSHMNDFLLHFDPDVMATMLMGVITPEGVMRYANAGHVPPVLVDARGHARLVEEPTEPALGAAASFRYRERVLVLDPGSTLILYTDGLVERRWRSLEEGLAVLRRAAETPWTNLDMLCEHLLETEATRPRLADDLALLALRIASGQPAEEVHTTVPADPRELPSLRRVLRRWLVRSGADAEQAQDVLVAVGEAAANSIEHAYGPGEGSVEVDAVASEGVLEIRIRDRGAWREPRGTDRGLGRSLMTAMMDEVTFETDEGGTIVTMRKRLRPSP
jgi:anti-sigma regulatory factor (Ser/Thr protein kinase)